MKDVYITPEQLRFVRERGFVAAERCPAIDSQFPYVALCGPQLEDDQVILYGDKGRAFPCNDYFHPVSESPEDLADKVEQFVAFMIESEQEKFPTIRGEHIPVFMEDGSWQEAVDILVKRRIYPV
ncbi:hypothetical protein KY359_00360 [Candidatus Woesearchaeota archaeon]|nr:hypothetical protein [Candidatus Woesearchaeota archaeon]